MSPVGTKPHFSITLPEAGLSMKCPLMREGKTLSGSPLRAPLKSEIFGDPAKGEVGVLKVRLGFWGIAMFLLQEVAASAIKALAAVAHAFLQRTLADRAHSVAVGAFDALCAATETVDTRGGNVHLVPLAPLAGDLLTQGVVVVYGGGSGVATGAVETAKGD